MTEKSTFLDHVSRSSSTHLLRAYEFPLTSGLPGLLLEYLFGQSSLIYCWLLSPYVPERESSGPSSHGGRKCHFSSLHFLCPSQLDFPEYNATRLPVQWTDKLTKSHCLIPVTSTELAWRTQKYFTLHKISNLHSNQIKSVKCGKLCTV
jgi:hypothetical protein